MKFFIDNNLPPALARALNELSAQYAGVEVVHLRERFHPGTADVQWINTLAYEGDWAIVSSDRFRKGDAVKLAFKQSGLTVFYLPKQWMKGDPWQVAYRLVRWWPKLINAAQLVEAGATYEVPWSVSDKSRLKTL